MKLKDDKPHSLAKMVAEALGNASYRENAEKISETFRKAGGSVRAADVIEQKMKHIRKH